MTTVDYTNYVTSRCKDYVDVNYCVVALNGEAGEVAEWHKKANLRGNPDYHDEMLKEELGDVLFYLTRLAALKYWTLNDLMDANKAKLDERVSRGVVVG